MKKIGIIGGVGWPSTVDYYRLISEASNKHFKNYSCPPILIYSLNFEEIKGFHFKKAWEETVPLLVEAAQALERAGADFILIASGTTNIPFRAVQAHVQIPILNIVQPTAEEVLNCGLKKIILLGTKATMEHAFFRSELEKKGLEVVVPNEDEREVIHRVIYEELCANVIRIESKVAYIKIVERLVKEGAEGLIMGCTEIPLLISQADFNVPVFNMSELHGLKAFEKSIS